MQNRDIAPSQRRTDRWTASSFSCGAAAGRRIGTGCTVEFEMPPAAAATHLPVRARTRADLPWARVDIEPVQLIGDAAQRLVVLSPPSLHKPPRLADLLPSGHPVKSHSCQERSLSRRVAFQIALHDTNVSLSSCCWRAYRAACRSDRWQMRCNVHRLPQTSTPRELRGGHG
jgi:hypothetical protein